MSKIALVTGGTSGIGLHTAAYLQSQGCTVYTVSRRPCDDARFHHICADVTQEADVARAVKSVLDEAGRIDILVNNAGISREMPFLEMPVEVFDEIMTSNMRSVMLVTRAVLPHMLEQKYGRIINIGSGAALRGLPGSAL